MAGDAPVYTRCELVCGPYENTAPLTLTGRKRWEISWMGTESSSPKRTPPSPNEWLEPPVYLPLQWRGQKHVPPVQLLHPVGAELRRLPADMAQFHDLIRRMYVQSPQDTRRGQQPGRKLICRLFLRRVSWAWFSVRCRDAPRPHMSQDDVPQLMSHGELRPSRRRFIVKQDDRRFSEEERHPICAVYGLGEIGPLDHLCVLPIGQGPDLQHPAYGVQADGQTVHAAVKEDPPRRVPGALIISITQAKHLPTKIVDVWPVFVIKYILGIST